VYQPALSLLDRWESPRPADYRGNHGMRMPVFGEP
jgi:hypothetical protein